MEDQQQIDVKGLREALGESQTAFAERFGVDQSTVARWETNGVPKRGAAKVAIERLKLDLQPVATN